MFFLWWFQTISDCKPFAQSVQSTSVSGGLPTEMQLGLLSPLYLRKLFERMGATYIKLGQVNHLAKRTA